MKQTVYSGGIKQTTTLDRRQLLDLFFANDNLSVYVQPAGSGSQPVLVDFQYVRTIVRRPTYSIDQPRSYEVIHYPASNELYIIEVNYASDEVLPLHQACKNTDGFDSLASNVAGKWEILEKAAQAIAAACEANGIPLNALLPLASHLAGELLNKRLKRS